MTDFANPKNRTFSQYDGFEKPTIRSFSRYDGFGQSTIRSFCRYDGIRWIPQSVVISVWWVWAIHNSVVLLLWRNLRIPQSDILTDLGNLPF